MTNIINQNTFEKFKAIREEYVAYMKTLNDDFIKQVIQELKVKYGDFAIVVRGYTPTWNDGDEVSHHYDYSICNGTTKSEYSDYNYFNNDGLYADENDDYKELLEINDENMTSINSQHADNPTFSSDMRSLSELIDEIYTTNYEVKIKVKGEEVTFDYDFYDCGY